MKKCSICGKFQNDGWIVENPADEPGVESFPDEFNKLLKYRVKREGTLEGYHTDEILQCPECGLLYEYSCTLPGGSYDAMRTWVVERLLPVIKKGKHLRKDPPPPQPEYEEVHEFICPACNSLDVECVNAGIIGGEVFISLKCRQCGNEDTLDQYQIISWRNVKNEEI